MDARTLCLGVLKLGEATGYEIKKAVEEGPFAHFHHSGFGSIYPALARLRAEGLVTCIEHEATGRPGRKVYSITPAGTEALTRALHKEPAFDKIRSEVLFMFFFAELLDDARRRALYERYLEEYRRLAEHVCSLDDSGLSGGRRFVRGFGRAIYETVVRYMEDNRHLLFEETREPEARRKTGRGA